MLYYLFVLYNTLINTNLILKEYTQYDNIFNMIIYSIC